MIRALRTLRAALSAWYYDLFVLIGVNLAWLILSLLILPLGPATAGLYYVASQVAKEEPISFGLFWVGFRRLLVKGWQVMFVILLVTFLIAVNIMFYLGFASQVMKIIGIVWVYVFIFWAIVLVYPFAVLMEMEKATLFTVFRNSVLLALDNPGFSVSMLILTLLVIGLSIVPLGLLPFPFGLFSLLAIFQSKGLRLVMDKYKGKT